MLYERRILVVSQSLSRLTACIPGAALLLHPMNWYLVHISLLSRASVLDKAVLSTWLSACLSVCMFACQCLSLYICLLSVCLPVSPLCMCLFVCLSVSVCLSDFLSVWLLCISVVLCVHSNQLSVSVFICCPGNLCCYYFNNFMKLFAELQAF